MNKHRTWLFLRDNFDTVLALVISITAAIFGAFGSTEPFVLAAIATTLGILSYSIIRDRGTRESVQRETQNVSQALQTILKNRASADHFFTTRRHLPNLRERLRHTQSLDMIGASLIGVSIAARGAFQSLKDSCGTIRLLVSNPGNDGLQSLMAMTFHEADNARAHIDQVNVALRSLIPLIGKSANGGSFDIRVTDHFIPFGYIGIDTGKSHGEIQVELYLKKVPVDSNPLFVIDSRLDNHWYGEFQHQFEHLWSTAKEIDEALRRSLLEQPSTGDRTNP